MKRFLLPVVVAALCGSAQAASSSADYAQAELTMKPNEVQVEQVAPRPEYFATKDSAKAINPAWHFVRIPYSLLGRCRDADKTPLYVDELKVHAYLLFTVPGKNDDKIILLDKEITYVNIPLSPKGKEGENKNVQAAVFISPSDAARICGEGTSKVERVDLNGKLSAVAVEFRFKDADCVKAETDTHVVLDKKMKSRLKTGWWKKETKSDLGVQLRAISDTPFAPFYAPAFPATSPMYGAAAPASASSSFGGTTGYTPSSATDSTETTSDTSAETEEPVAPTKKSKKRRK
jgi:hypothetical protein